MSERLRQITEAQFIEQLSPRFTPEIAFQSYEMLDGDPSYRAAEMARFSDGEIRNPILDYPLIDERTLQAKIRVLERYLTQVDVMSDETARQATWDTISYRIAEMYWLLEAVRMNRCFQESGGRTNEFRQSAQRFRYENEVLYGTPDKDLTDKVLGEIWQQIESKELNENGKCLLEELRRGTNLQIGDEMVTIPALRRGESGERLPQNLRERLAPLREVLLEEFADVKQLIDDYYRTVCLARPMGSPDYGMFTVTDMQAVFEAVRDMRDPENGAGIDIRVNQNATALSWDTPTMSVVIGEKRAKISDALEMFAKVVHEYGVHGMRAVNGKRSRLPILGAGLFTDATDGESSDYLTFEEGFASLCEAAILDKEEGWEPLYISRYLAAAATYDGLDFRQSYEQNWRVRTLMSVVSGEPIGNDIMQKQMKQACLATVRIRRATPTDYTGDIPLTFNKDLAYLTGKVKALEYLESVEFNRLAVRRLFAGKFDPTNRVQNALVDQYSTLT